MENSEIERLSGWRMGCKARYFIFWKGQMLFLAKRLVDHLEPLRLRPPTLKGAFFLTLRAARSQEECGWLFSSRSYARSRNRFAETDSGGRRDVTKRTEYFSADCERPVSNATYR